MRLDAYLVENGMAQSRSRARAMIESANVLVSGAEVLKASYKLADDDVVVLKAPDHPYVSRAALKLKALLDEVSADFSDRVVLDVGASTGGFTQVALEHGAKKVFAVDVGRDQLAQALREDERVVVMEQTDGRALEKLTPAPQILVSDVSFISQTKVLPAVLASQEEINQLFILVKPQFELEPKDVGCGGLVKDAKARERACARVKACVEEQGFSVKLLIPSPIAGGDGNLEFLLHAKKDA